MSGFLYVTLAALGAGMIVSTVRWLLVDTIHACTGIRHPAWDFSKLEQNVAAYDVLVRIHYQFYQYNANMLVATMFLYSCRWGSLGWQSFQSAWDDLGFLVLATIFFLGSRDTHRKYFIRVATLLGTQSQPPDSLESPSSGPTHESAEASNPRESLLGRP